MNFSDEVKKSIALAIHTGTDFFIENGRAYEGNRDDVFADYEEWASDKGAEARFSEWLETEGIELPEYEDDDDNYLVCTDSEADEKARDAIRELLWAFNPSFLAGETGIDEAVFSAIQANGRCEDNNEAILRLVGNGFDDLVDHAIGCDGRGHFLAHYDGKEARINLFDVTGENEYFYIYRLN